MAFGDCTNSEIYDTYVDCNVVAGLERVLYAIPWDGWTLAQTKTFDVSEKFLKALVLANNYQAYRLTQPQNTVTSKITGAKSDAMLEEYTPEVVGYMSNTASNKKTAEAYANGRWVVIAELIGKGFNNVDAFQVIGHTAGLTANVEYDSTSMKGLIKVTFTSFDNAKESALPLTFTTNENADTYVVDKAYLEALLTPAS